jgi:hypothetical protein
MAHFLPVKSWDGNQSSQARHAGIGDAGLETLAEIPSLQMIDLSETAVTNDGLSRLAELPRLSALVLCDTGISDPGLKTTLETLSTNRLWLCLTATRTLPESIAGLQAARPEWKFETRVRPTWTRDADFLEMAW